MDRNRILLKRQYAQIVYDMVMEINDTPDLIADQEYMSGLVREAWNLSIVTLRENANNKAITN